MFTTPDQDPPLPEFDYDPAFEDDEDAPIDFDHEPDEDEDNPKPE